MTGFSELAFMFRRITCETVELSTGGAAAKSYLIADFERSACD
jgi:hypothetical protein